ncbi:MULTISPECIES: GlxA family transcriptional regulator [unclassified Pseudomonas]|uniref:GlxA family transcriptional regulator n=1 Tax=unclassified Pseudomonas TaxID=196821 RepID=UPI0035C02B47
MNECAPKTLDTAPIRVGFLVFPGFQPIDLSGPWQAFAAANEEMHALRYVLSTHGPAEVAATSDGALRVLVDQPLEPVATLHTLIVPGGEGVHAALENPEVRRWLVTQDHQTLRTCSVCTGAFLLAAAGLLEGQRVTTHWRKADALRQAFPTLAVCDERIFCESGKYWTSAGVTAGIDLALALIERDCGALVAQKVARRLVVHLRRQGDQRQYSEVLRMQDRAGVPFKALIERIERDLALPWTVDDMAEASNMSRRTFQRKFKKSFGMTSLAVLKALRQERGHNLLAAGTLPRKEVARQVGLSVVELGGEPPHG